MVIRSRSTRPQLVPEFAYNDDKSRGKTHRAQAVVVPLTVLLILTVILAVGRIVFNLGVFSKHPTIPDNAFSIEENVGLLLNFRKAEDGKNVTLGPHEATLFIAKPCKEPRFVMRLVGEEALHSIPIVQIDEFRWSGSFQIPFPGLYVVDSRWYGCDASQESNGFKAKQINIAVSGHRETTNYVRLTPSFTSIPNLIPEGFWASPKLYTKMSNKRFWITRAMGAEPPHFMTSSTRLGASLLAKEATPVHSRFADLSNYELLCWVGSASAAITRDSFLSILPSVAKQQRPFKFHYYPMDDFRTPDDGWETEYKLKFRKCKIIVVSVDELKNPVSQDDYKLQVSTFLQHLVKMFDDETFPIWMLTVNLPSPSNASMCTDPKRRTNHHPCNDALFDLFGATKAFPDRVRLLDNTDLTDPLLDEGLQDAVAVIAMRIFAIAGQQVNTWRKSNQRGTKQGLIRNGKLEPNVVFTVYDFNS